MKEIILYDSDQACTKGKATFEDGTEVTMFKAVQGNQAIYTPDEHVARWHGCTHKVCPETGEVFEKGWVYGPTVRARRELERYQNATQADRGFPIFVGHTLFMDVDEMLEHFCDQEEFDGLSDVWFAGKVPLSTVDIEDIMSEVDTEYYDPSPRLLEAIASLNNIIEAEDTCYYTATNERPTDEQLAEWTEFILEERAKSREGTI